MSRLILIQEDDYERQYRESMNYLNSKYHDQPTRLKNIPTDENDIGGQMANGVRVPAGKHTPTGKLVI